MCGPVTAVVILHGVSWQRNCPGLGGEGTGVDIDAVEGGHYYKDQAANTNPVIAWSHRSRYEKAISLIDRPNSKVLDYGCGDATFLAMASDRIAEGYGCDIDEHQIQDCRDRLGAIPNLHFVSIGDLGEDYDGAFDVVTCQETLEHCTDEAIDTILDDIARLCSPTGRVIISVPIEIGPSFAVKQSIRALAARMGNSSYHVSERYGPRDAARMVFARASTKVERPLYEVDGLTGYSHFGFNWRALRERVAQTLEVVDTEFTPLGALGGFASSQAWFLCRPRR
ncbi:class I SAM-dependent methyltransferase [Mycobacterium sp. CBMA361]|nr:class I SAM-dependent methyltransferase [Mycolicibacterium sp. CBMA 361]